MSSNTSASPEPVSKISKPVSAKKAPAKKAVSKPKSKPSSASHPPWKEIIVDCIVANRDGSARSGVSRSIIKKYAQETYKLEPTGPALYQLNRAIASGVEVGLFVLPKGPSGKVKLAPKVPKISNENTKPPSTKKAPAAKPATKVAAKPKTAKAAPVKKAAPKTASKTAPKTASKTASKAAPKTAARKPVAKAATKAAATKKVVAKKAAAKPAPAKKATSAKRVEKKKVAAKAAATKPRARAAPAARGRK